MYLLCFWRISNSKSFPYTKMELRKKGGGAMSGQKSNSGDELVYVWGNLIYRDVHIQNLC